MTQRKLAEQYRLLLLAGVAEGTVSGFELLFFELSPHC